MKRKLLFSILALFVAAFLPLTAFSKHIHARHHETAPAEKPASIHKYELALGYGYTSLNQVYQSRYGLQGVDASVTRDWGRFFGLTADGAYYKYPLRHATPGNPGNPSVDALLFGPVLHAKLFGHVDVLAHALLGGEHTGGENMTPNISFAAGVGGGAEYKLSPHFAVRASGDYIGASFSVRGNSSSLGYSPHRSFDSRATIGVVYKF